MNSDTRQYGDLANQLLLESRRSTQTDTLLKYNDSLVRTIIREQRDLEKAMSSLMIDGQPPPPALLIIQTTINRNKRCLLAYHAHRTDRLRDLYWVVGGALPHILSDPDIRSKLSPHEVDYLRQYNSSVMEFRAEFSNELDITASITQPPKDLQVLVKVVKECGVIQTELGTIDFQRGHRFMVRRADIEHLIVQGYLEEPNWRSHRSRTRLTTAVIAVMLNGHLRHPTDKVLKISTRLTSNQVVPSQCHALSLVRPLHQLSMSQGKTLHLPRNVRCFSDLGLRSQRPPDTLPDPKEVPQPPEVGDNEWEIRTGRAIYVIQDTLPEFFQNGLIVSLEKTTGNPSRPTSPFTSTASLNILEPLTMAEDLEPIYSPNIRMQYTPPIELPAPFPKTFHIEGLQLYLTSSGVIRHTMNALYSDLTLRTTKLVIKSPPSIPSVSDSKKPRISRDKSFIVRQIVTGVARVSGKPAEWEIESTYTFSPITGLVHQHIINSIQPAPHLAVYDSLRLSLGKLLGWTPEPPTARGAVCKGDPSTHHS